MPGQARTSVYGSAGNPESLDPGLVTTTMAMNATWQMLDSLVELAPGTIDLQPASAESRKVSDLDAVRGFRTDPLGRTLFERVTLAE